ncbi:PQQ-binding-like beta-propeller repeat protein [Kordiimonas sp.]|uniref:outer membrane protein assembly factor BamB family protein n=1 Tax=Kordiimonas sp. TaxID=1970157 RepID=UPI003A8FFF36
MNKVLRFGLLGMTALAVAACSGGSKKPRGKYDDEGRERIAILSSTQILDADSGIASLPVVLPAPYTNGNWAQVGGNPSHRVQHLDLADSLSLAWRRKIGAGNDKYERMVAGPVSADGRVFAVDTRGGVTAVALSDGRQLWKNDLKDVSKERSDVGFGGGVAYAGGNLYVTSGYGSVVALDAKNGRQIWHHKGEVPFRGAPTASGNRVFAITHDNQMLAFNAADGSVIWEQVGIAETAGMLGAASPAYDGTALIAALSSGELIALRGANGRILWQDALSSSRRLTPLATLSDIDGEPVIDRGKVYAVSHAGSMVAIDMRSGERSWEADIAGVNMPWVAGDFAFVTTIDSQIVAVALGDGRVRWVSQLQRFENQEKRRDLIKWNGPVLAGDRLLVTSSHGYAVSLSPYTGAVLSAVEMPAGSSTAPIVVNGTFIVLTDTGELVAYR